MRKIYREIMDGCEWIVDADLRDFFGTVHNEPLIDMIAEQVSDGRILKLVRQMLEAGYRKVGRNMRRQAAHRKVDYAKLYIRRESEANTQ